MKQVRVQIYSEVATSRRPARVCVYEGEELIAEVEANIEPKQGADGGYYDCVVLKEVEPRSSKNCL